MSAMYSFDQEGKKRIVELEVERVRSENARLENENKSILKEKWRLK